MSSQTILRIEGEVDEPLTLSFDDFRAISPEYQIPDISQVDPKRKGRGVTLEGLLTLAAARPAAKYLTLHATADDFHASVPLEAVRARALLIYELDGQPLPKASGGPARLLIPDFAACHTAEVDECANVKFVDRIELTATRGFDNRPHDDAEHAKLHEAEQHPETS